MEFHLERGLRLKTQPEYKNLYTWAINEIDAQGQTIGRDQIPWAWSLTFTALSCVLGDSFQIKSQWPKENAKPREVIQRQAITVALRPGRPQDDDDYLSKTTFSMFGTERVIKSFQLGIYPIADSSEEETCTAWGTPSYTAEIDFRNETSEDCIVFYMFVKPDMFARYAAKIAHGLVDEIIFQAGSVAGFYSEWSPSISTNSVKVLTTGSEQNIAVPADVHFEPPRLGDVGDAELYINRKLEFATRKAGSEPVETMSDARTLRAVPDTRGRVAVEVQTMKMLGSLKRAAWVIVLLLALIFVATLLDR